MLIELAGAHVEQLAPAFAKKLRTERAAAVKSMLATAAEGPLLPTDAHERFTMYRRLLNQTHQVRLSIFELRVAAVMLGFPSEAQAFQDLEIGDAERFYCHLAAWAVMRSGLYERTKRLTSMSVRRLRLKSTESRKELERYFSDLLDKGRDTTKLLRDTATHGGNLLDRLEDIGTWEIAAVARGWPDEQSIYNMIWRNREQHKQIVLRQTLADFEYIGNCFQDLDGRIDWDAAQPQVGT